MARRHAQHVYVDAERASNERSKAFLTNAPNLRKWWSTVKTTVFDAGSSLPPLLDRRGRLVWSANGKAFVFSAHFDAKLCRNSFQQQQSRDSCPVLRSVAFRSSFLCSLLLDLDLYGENNTDGMFPLFCKQVACELVFKLTIF